MRSIEWCKIIRYLQFFSLAYCCLLAFFSCYLIYYNNEIILFCSVFCNDFGKNGIYFDIFPLKVWRLSFNCLPLHSLSEIISVGTTKEAFFENIYIDREVVREARRVGLWALIALISFASWVNERAVQFSFGQIRFNCFMLQ